MTVYFENESGMNLPFDCEKTAREVAMEVLEYENCPYEAQFSLTLTTEDEMRTINNNMRKIDAPTDVLSFPMTDYPAPADFAFLEESQDAFDPDSGELLLGDIVICVERVYRQAGEYGHSLLREYAFLIAHSMLHLIGYDHMEEEEARRMEQKQEEILLHLGITRDI
ncbi:MAG: rRNA maturation RNase YbeY [Eubacteriales bacterium]|nr:rRNA maturation RNase YbeY [Eubacteriales bacterium]